MNTAAFETRIRGRKTCLIMLHHGGMKVAITNYGARIVQLIVPDASGKETDVVIGFDSIEGYLNSKETYYGAIVGRYANRIARGRFSLDGNDYQLAINNPPNHLHGGPDGFHHQVWEVEEQTGSSVCLHYFSEDGEEEYPGNLDVYVRYTITDEQELLIEYEATTDAATVLNFTSHAFFNLNGQGNGTIHDHQLQIHATHYNPVNGSLIPAGIVPVTGTPFDFLQPHTIGSRINENDQQLVYGAGYDHNYVLDGNGYRTVARAVGDRTGISMDVLTDQPGMQLYSGNYLKSENPIKYGMIDEFRTAFCLETQHFPDSPNQPQFPSTVLRPGETFRSRTAYRFGHQL